MDSLMYEIKKEEALKYAEEVRQKQELEEIRHSNDKEKKRLSFSKIAVIFIFVNCLIIELYSMVIMALFHDLTSLGSLIMAVLGQCAGLLGYFVKAGRENIAGGITYETAMFELNESYANNSIDEDDGAVG